ncbi:hypothetical protein MPC38_06810 [Prescottella equi]|uniref:hypothetical protein n=1 Tax=Rhodococcus hoagii TaxID=43767 RepID=UPI001F5B5001|nr:hypothetical protein [Prescottella equi]UNQ40956.1 hypothetical protein MPC38_06810 [Prescottella equi]
MINPAKYKDVQFYSELTYQVPRHRGFVQSAADRFGSQELNSTVPIPASITTRPPFIQYFLVGANGVPRLLGGDGALNVGHDANNMYFSGYSNLLPYNEVFRIYYVIYDRPL